MNNDDVLELASDLPTVPIPPGEILINEEAPSAGVFILRSGTLEVRRGGQLVAIIEEPGTFVGEMSMLLESPSTADVVARDNVAVHEIEDPRGFFAANPDVTFFLAGLLAQRLNAVTGYLSELKEEHGDTSSHLHEASTMVDQLLASRGTAMMADPSDDEIAAAAEFQG